MLAALDLTADPITRTLAPRHTPRAALLPQLQLPVGLVGDIDQLPSVGPGQVLADSIASGILSRSCG